MAKQPTGWRDRIVLENGIVTRILTAEYHKGKHDIEIDVYQETENGDYWIRNCYCSVWSGWVVLFPGLSANTNPYSYYYDRSPAEIEEWKRIDKPAHLGSSCSYITQEEKGAIILNNYDFKYVFQKYDFKSKAEVMEKLRQWKKHPEIELILAAGFEKLAMNNSLYRMTKENRKAIMNFCRTNPNAKDLSLQEIRQCIKSDNPQLYIEYLQSIYSWMRKEFSFDDFKYLEKKSGPLDRDTITRFCDYRAMLRNSIHNPENDYWKYPNDWEARHNQLIQEREMAEQIKRKHELEAKTKERQAFIKVTRKYKRYDGEVDGFHIFFTDSVDEWELQAKELHQCIMYANYMEKVAKRHCLLAFIRKDGKPVATAQIMPGHKINQFYGDEHDRDNCKPSPEVENAFYKWFENVVIKEAI